MSDDPRGPDDAGARPVPTGTYRLQLTPDFGFDAAAAVVPYLADLGVSHVYCSPYLQAAPASMHGYDVIDHGRLNAELGGEEAHARLVAALRSADLGLLVDVVPNHMAVSAPESQNAAWWDLLKHGRDSAYARWFDVDWDSRDNPGKVLLPVLGTPLAEVLAAGELVVDGDRVRYYAHEAPLAPGTERLPLPEVLDHQHWRLCHWRVAADELDYRRFFDVTTLAAVRVEDPDVFAATHRVVLAQVRDGVLDGLRIDHPDGLADPGGYLRRLADVTSGAWVAVEKILEHGEALPTDWRCAGTTGYDALNLLTGVFVDPAGAEPLTTLYGQLTREPTDWPTVVDAAKAHVVRDVLRPEVARLAELVVAAAWSDRATRDTTRRGLSDAVAALLESFDVYRAYVTPGEPPPAASVETVARAVRRAKARLPHLATEIDVVGRLVLTGPAELVVRFQQTCGPVMAKGVEDTAFYRYGRLLALNEVGGDPGVVGRSTAEFHHACTTAQRDWPLGMTTLSTHDTKRAEDVRARLVLLSEDPAGWGRVAAELLALGERHVGAAGPDRGAQYFLLQTLVGAWPLPVDRALPYMEKATREAKLHTSWTDPVPAYDEALAAYVRGVLEDPAFVTTLERYVATLVEPGRVNGLAQKLLQLTMPGVPDVYQGTEVWSHALVDPDNRRPVDHGELARLLARLDSALPAAPRIDGRAEGDPGTAKLHLVRVVLRLRREHPEWFGRQASYEPLTATGAAADHVVAYARAGRVVPVVPRLVLGLRRAGGWKDTALPLPPGDWTDLLTGRRHGAGVVYALRLLRDFPVALLVTS